MKVIITDRFNKRYLKLLLKYFTKEEFVKHLKERSHTFIPLNYPFAKLKNKINNFAFKGFLAVIQDEKIIPLIMFTKKDEGENLNWRDYKGDIKFEYEKNIEDIENKQFKEF